MLRIFLFLFLSIAGIAFSIPCCKANSVDSVTVKPVKRYIRPCFYFNHYVTPERPSPSQKQYRFAQTDLGFYLPLYTTTWFNKDNISLSSLQVIGITDMVRFQPQLDYINESYTIGRLSAGIRVFYSDGGKSIFYASFTPFISQEFMTFNSPLTRFTGAFIYSRTVSRIFAYRLGVARSYTFGTALPLPVVGFRFGALDRLHLNVQFPRNVSLDFPIGKRVTGSVYTKLMGGLYNVVTDGSQVTVQGAPVGPGTPVRLRRYEMLHGVQFNFRASQNISFYISTGFLTRRSIQFSQKEVDPQYSTFKNTKEKIPNSIFVSFGLTIFFGKSKKVYNDVLMYDLFDLNTINKAGFNDTGPMDNGIPANPSKYKENQIKNLKYKDVQDLVTDDY